MPLTPSHRRTNNHCRGAALLMVLFMVLIVSTLVLNVLNTEVSQFAATRNVLNYERALYLANAGVHNACVELTLDPNLRGAVPDSDTDYTATITEVSSGVLEIQSTGQSGGVNRTIVATVEL